MKIYNKEKTELLDESEINYEYGYVVNDKILTEHIPAATYTDWNEETGLVEHTIPEQDIFEDVLVYIPYTEEELRERKLNRLRTQRKTECFAIINRGKLWYDRLADEQRVELDDWYQAWLNVTITLEIPIKPNWLK